MRTRGRVAVTDIADIAHAKAVNQNFTGRNTAGNTYAVARKFNYSSVFADNDIFARHTQRLGKLCMFNQMAVFSVHRHKEFRAHQIVHHFNFFLAGMAGNMNTVAFFVTNVGA